MPLERDHRRALPAEDRPNRGRLRPVISPCRCPMCLHAGDLPRPNLRTLQTTSYNPLHRPTFAVHVCQPRRVRSAGIACHDRHRLCPSRPRVIRRLEDQGRRPFADHEPRPLSVERLACLRRDLAPIGQHPHPQECRRKQRIQARLDGSRNGDWPVAILQPLHRADHGMQPGATRGNRRENRPLDLQRPRQKRRATLRCHGVPHRRDRPVRDVRPSLRPRCSWATLAEHLPDQPRASSRLARTEHNRGFPQMSRREPGLIRQLRSDLRSQSIAPY